MQQSKSLLKNGIFNIMKTFSSLVFPIATFAYASRIIGEAGIGKVSFTKSFITYFTMLAVLGMNFYGTREAAKLRYDRDKLSKFVHEMLFINGATTVLAYVLLFLTILFVPKLQDYKTLLLINSFAIVLQSMSMEWLYQALEEYKYIAMRSILFQIGTLVAMLVLVRDSGDVVPYAVVTLVATSGTYVLNFVNARKYIRRHWYGNYEIRKHLKPLLWLFALAVSIELYTVLDSTMLGFIQGDAAVGRYTAAIKVHRMVNSLITAIGVVLIPRLSYFIGLREYEKVKALVNKAYNCVFMLSIPAAVGLFILSNEIILLFCGRQFASAGTTMRIMTPIVLLIPFSMMTNQQTFVPMGKEKLILLSTMVGAVTNILFNSILIPRFAENGAAFATVISELCVALVCLYNANRFFDVKLFFEKYHQYWLAALPISMVALVIQKLVLGRNLFVEISITVALSAAVYFLLLYFFKNELLIFMLKRLLRKSTKGESPDLK